jgi:hypothetical protein
MRMIRKSGARDLLKLLAASLVVVALRLRTCSGGPHLPGAGLSFQQLSPTEAVTELRTCAAKYASYGYDNISVVSGWAGRLLQNDSTPVVVGPLVPKAGSTTMRLLFGDPNRPDALTTVDEFLQLRAGNGPQAKAATDKLWFAVVRDPMTRFVDAYIQIANQIKPHKERRAECAFKDSQKAECVQAR